MNLSNLLWPAVGVGLIYASKKVSAIPDPVRAPLAVIGTLMAVKNIAFVQDKI